jgi:hypothetical protein
MNPDGSARVHARERLLGVLALEWREALDQIPTDQVQKEFEQRWLGYFFAGATLRRLRIEGREEVMRDLVFDYEFTLPAFGRRVGAALVVPGGFFPVELRKRYVGVARRQAPLLVLEHPPTELHVEVRLPAGAHATLPRPLELTGPFGSFSSRATQRGDRLVLDRRCAVQLRRIPPSAYADFVAFATAVDQAEAAGVTVSLP